MTVDRKRHGRQIRLAEVGEAGQERLASYVVAPSGEGAARELEIVYLRAAGVPLAPDAPAADAARPDVAPVIASLGIADPAARDVADGALRSLLVIRAALGVGEPG